VAVFGVSEGKKDSPSRLRFFPCDIDQSNRHGIAVNIFLKAIPDQIFMGSTAIALQAMEK
jgi:hypothetical protein